MKVYFQDSPAENAVATLKNLLTLLNVQVTKGSIETVVLDPEYPSLNSLSSALSRWNIENVGLQLSIEQLSEIPYPSIAHLSKKNGHFVVLQKLKEGTIQYIDSEVGVVSESLSEFDQK